MAIIALIKKHLLSSALDEGARFRNFEPSNRELDPHSWAHSLSDMA